jgi:hypothetical protein
MILKQQFLILASLQIKAQSGTVKKQCCELKQLIHSRKLFQLQFTMNLRLPFNTNVVQTHFALLERD